MRILVVDDSSVFRMAITTALENAIGPGVERIQTAQNGKRAIELLNQFEFDIMVLDLEMPVMDGIETIKEVRKTNKDLIIIVFSSQTLISAQKTLNALELGADEFMQKVEGHGSASDNIKLIADVLVPKITGLYEARKTICPLKTDAQAKRSLQHTIDVIKPEIVCIGSSTGGPEALKKVIPFIEDSISCPLLVVQHMPPIFTKQLADSLDAKSKLKVVEATHGDILEKGTCYIAPGDYHMHIDNTLEGKKIRLGQEEKVCFVRPSVDVTLFSLAENIKGNVLTLILTGMGDDGKNGCEKIKHRGGHVVIQDEASCVVWGMPGAVYKSGHFDEMITLDEMAQIINKVA